MSDKWLKIQQAETIERNRQQREQATREAQRLADQANARRAAGKR